MIRQLAIITGSRAEYGLLRPLMALVRDHPATRLQLIVTGTHLEARFGHTVDAIVDDGYAIDAAVPMPVPEDTPLGIARAMGQGLPGLVETFMRLRPDLLIMLGDRYEMLCAAQAAMLSNLPLAHIHGGEASLGTMDESIRHAITKLAHLHFTAAEPYRNRVIQMGESPSRVWNVGAIGLDAIRGLTLMSRGELEQSLGWELGERFFLITYHPVTFDRPHAGQAVAALLGALERFGDYRLLFTGVNADPGHEALERPIRHYCHDHPHRAFHVASLGQIRYLSAMKHCAAVVGNSSSGIIEAPAMDKPTINIGRRQMGRLRAASVIDCADDIEAISQALAQAISPGFQAAVRQTTHPFGDGQAAERIFSVVRSHPLEDLLIKRFYDLPVPTPYA
ncbi:MAG: UDP-N-acetylglucosamine 2-epimerase (hydrolyzing) [Magnetococcales bacterium]|nr:UDP-N-acetylglucosamine 2-epimerase (hydrolyzing) [Magnetococcales bacterium]